MTRVETLRNHLRANSYWMAYEALDFAVENHKGARNNGDPEISHPVETALQLIESGMHMDHPEETITAALVHDLPEDYDIGFDTLEIRFGDLVARGVKTVTKKHKGMEFSFSAKMREASRCPIGSLVKASDRLHNLKTLEGAFPHKKALQYIAETHGEIIPALEFATKAHPSQSSSVSFFLDEIRSAAAAYLHQPILTAAE